jgi:hypothetical protein
MFAESSVFVHLSIKVTPDPVTSILPAWTILLVSRTRTEKRTHLTGADDVYTVSYSFLFLQLQYLTQGAVAGKRK